MVVKVDTVVQVEVIINEINKIGKRIFVIENFTIVVILDKVKEDELYKNQISIEVFVFDDLDFIIFVIDR